MVTPTPRDRKLNGAHFAFMRGLVQGLPLRETWERYLQVEGSSSDLRIVRTTIAWIRDAFAAAARREARFSTARLVLIDVSQLPADKPALPLLEEFAENAAWRNSHRPSRWRRTWPSSAGRVSASLVADASWRGNLRPCAGWRALSRNRRDPATRFAPG